jgi:hypothetical protein
VAVEFGVGGCQAGLNSLSGRIYPPAIRSTGAGSALGWRAQGIFIAPAIPAFGITLLMAMLGRLGGQTNPGVKRLRMSELGQICPNVDGPTRFQ